MRFYEPVLQLGALMPPQTALVEKFGGLPWGLPAEKWPVCSTHGKAQSFIAQFVHDDARLDLGAPGRVLFIFQCNVEPGMCDAWSATSGANACVILEPTELVKDLTAAPTAETPADTEARIIGWTAGDDGVQPEDAPLFFSDETYATIATELLDGVPSVTKAGGAPVWVQGASEGPPPPWRFALQLDSLHQFHGPVPSADEVGCIVTRCVGEEYTHERPKDVRPGSPPWISVTEDGYFCDASNFGGGGSAYVFVRSDGARSEGAFFWQC